LARQLRPQTPPTSPSHARPPQNGGFFKQFAAILLLRLTPVVPYSASNYVLGLTPISMPAYVGGTFTGVAAWALVYASLGGASRKLLEKGVKMDVLFADLADRSSRWVGALGGALGQQRGAGGMPLDAAAAVGRGPFLAPDGPHGGGLAPPLDLCCRPAPLGAVPSPTHPLTLAPPPPRRRYTADVVKMALAAGLLGFGAWALWSWLGPKRQQAAEGQGGGGGRAVQQAVADEAVAGLAGAEAVAVGPMSSSDSDAKEPLRGL
jgi:hypothetical protein